MKRPEGEINFASLRTAGGTSPSFFTPPVSSCWAMISDLGAALHALLWLSLHGHLIGLIVKQSGVKSGTKMPPATSSFLWVPSRWVDMGHRRVWGVCSLGERSDKREEAPMEGLSFLLIFLQIMIYTVVSKRARYFHYYLRKKCLIVCKCCQKFNTHVGIPTVCMISLTIFSVDMHLLRHYKSDFFHL